MVICEREPRYHGRTLTSWLRQYCYTPLDESQRRQEAQNAVSAIGAKKAIPKLLNLVEAEDDPVSLWLIARTGKFRIRFLRWSSSERYSFEDYERMQWHSAEDFQQLGIAGFEMLGTNAAPADGKLEKLLNEKDHAFTAKRCLEFTGKPTEFVFCRALTNRDAAIRQWAIDELASVTDDVGVYIARIKPSLQDSSAAVRGTAVDAIGIQTSAPELAIPLLISALKDSAVSANAANALANFGTNALVAFPILTNLVERGDTNVASAALRTLIVITPERSLPILTNCIARGNPGIDGALKALRDVAPGQALPIILNRFQSSDSQTRRVAFRLLCLYPMTPKIEPAMQTAAADSDSVIADHAKEILTEKYQKEHPLESQFSDDPSYEGKRLGEWLKMHDSDGFLSQDATNAIQHLGTNAIPALLQRLSYVQPPFGLPGYDGGVHMDAVRGFITLGEKAVPAFTELETLMDGTNQNVILYAMVSALGTGSNAIPVLVKGLTNQFADVRGEAAHSLTEGVADRFPEHRKEIISLLVKLLNDPDPDVRQSVRGDLNEIESAMSAKSGIK